MIEEDEHLKYIRAQQAQIDALIVKLEKKEKEGTLDSLDVMILHKARENTELYNRLIQIKGECESFRWI